METDMLNHPGPHHVGTLVEDLKRLLAFMVHPPSRTQLLDQTIIKRAHEAVSNYPENDPNEATDQQHMEMREHAWCLVMHLECHRDTLQDFDWKLVENVSRWMQRPKPRVEPEPDICEWYKRGHIYGASLNGRVCIGCKKPEPKSKGNDIYQLVANQMMRPGEIKSAAGVAKSILTTPQAPGGPVTEEPWPRRFKVDGIDVVQAGPNFCAVPASSVELSKFEPADAAAYERISLSSASARWLKERLSMLKLDLLIERKRLLRDRGSDTTRHVMALGHIEDDLTELNRVIDALERR